MQDPIQDEDRPVDLSGHEELPDMEEEARYDQDNRWDEYGVNGYEL